MVVCEMAEYDDVKDRIVTVADGRLEERTDEVSI